VGSRVVGRSRRSGTTSERHIERPETSTGAPLTAYLRTRPRLSPTAGSGAHYLDPAEPSVVRSVSGEVVRSTRPTGSA
jgi:hypothetical protein